MRIVVFGGSFNPPHKGHLNSAAAAAAFFQPDLFLVIPDFQPPHKELAEGSPTPEQRLALCRLNFAAVPGAQVSDLEICRGGRSYTADTLRRLRSEYPAAELVLLVGTDMLLTLDRWRDADYILRTAVVGAFARAADEHVVIAEKAAALKAQYGAVVTPVPTAPLPAASTDIRAALGTRSGTDALTDAVYAYIVRSRLYGVKVSFPWLRERAYAMLKPKRIPHVAGCEAEAVRLANRWGADAEMAAEAAILHDCTKKETLPEQLILCEKYGIMIDSLERENEKLLHAKTGAAVAAAEFGADEAVCSAIRWHTTGRPDMRLLEKIVYMADYIEPNRDFDGVDVLRRLAYEDLDKAMVLGFEMSLDDIRSRGGVPHENTLAALRWYKEGRN